MNNDRKPFFMWDVVDYRPLVVEEQRCVPIKGESFYSPYAEWWVSDDRATAVARLDFTERDGKKVLKQVAQVEVYDSPFPLVIPAVPPQFPNTTIPVTPLSWGKRSLPSLVATSVAVHKSDERRMTAVTCLVIALIAFLFWYWSSIK